MKFTIEASGQTGTVYVLGLREAIKIARHRSAESLSGVNEIRDGSGDVVLARVGEDSLEVTPDGQSLLLLEG